MEDIDIGPGLGGTPQQYQGNFFDDDLVPRVRLEKEVDLTSLQNGGEFEIDGSELPVEYEEMDYKNDEVYKYLNPEIMGDDDDSESENTEQGSFERWAVKMDDISPLQDKGVMKKVITQGAGDLMPEEAFVTVHYNAYLEGLDEPFDSTHLRSRPLRFSIGKGAVVPGLDIGVRTMKMNEVSRFLFKPDYFLGAAGCPPRIPGGTTVMFVVELKKFEESGGADEYYTMTNEEKREANWSLIGKVVQREKGEGNDHYNSGRWVPALRHYNQAIRLAEDCRLKDEDEEKSQRKFLFKLYKNAALAGLKLKRYKLCLSNMGKALEYDPNDAQCLYIRGKALHGMGQSDQAKQCLIKAKRLKPNSRDIAHALKKLETDMKHFKADERALCAKMFNTANIKEITDEKVETSRRKKDDPDMSDEGFRESVMNKLVGFKNNEAATELPLPSDLSPGHLAVIADICMDLDMEMRTIGEGANLHYRVYKGKDK